MNKRLPSLVETGFTLRRKDVKNSVVVASCFSVHVKTFAMHSALKGRSWSAQAEGCAEAAQRTRADHKSFYEMPTFTARKYSI